MIELNSSLSQPQPFLFKSDDVYKASFYRKNRLPLVVLTSVFKLQDTRNSYISFPR